MELGAVLVIEHQGNLTRGMTATAEIPTDAWELEVGENQRHLGAILQIVLIVVALKAANGFKGTAQLHVQQLGAAEQIAVLI